MSDTVKTIEKSNEHAQNVTDKVVELLNAGNAPWQKPLAAGETHATVNGYNGYSFSGANSLILQMSQQERGVSTDSRWVSFYDVNKLGLRIAKGSRGVLLEDLQTFEKKPVLTKDGEPVLDAEGKETFEKVALNRPKLHHKHFFHASSIENFGENMHSPETLPEKIKGKDLDRLMTKSAKTLGMDSDPLRSEIARYMLAAKYGTGFEPKADLDTGAIFASDPRAFFRVARDANHLMGHTVADPERKLAIEGYVSANTERAAQKEQAVTKREYIQVSYNDRVEAKNLGARWDGKAKEWFAPATLDDTQKAALLEKFPAGKIERTPSMAAPEAFGQFLRDNGVKLEGLPTMDGEFHRVAVEGDKKGKESGSYKGFSDGRANGLLVNHKLSQEPIKWVHSGQEMSESDKAFIAQQTKDNREKANQQKLEANQKAAKTAFGIYANAESAHHQHPYLASKDIRDSEALAGIKVGRSGDLIVPLRSLDGKLSSVQFIKPDGAKFFQSGGAIKGKMHIVGDYQAVRKGEGNRILIAEGFATAASLHAATKLPVVVAFNGGNLTPVAEVVREHNPKATIIIAGDNDLKSERNIGSEKAFEASAAVNGKVILPLFTKEEADKGLTDWNDLASSRGQEAASKTINAAMKQVAPERSKQRESDGMEMS